MTSKIVVNNIEADAGISTVAFNDQIRVGSATTIHSTGIDLGSGNINSHNINSSGIVTAIGLDINGNGDISGNLNVAGVLTYEDVTSVDAVGLSTFQAGIHVTGGSVGIGTDNPIFKLDVVDGGGGANTGANVNNPDALSVTGTNRTLTAGGANLFVNSNSDVAANTGGQIALSGRHVSSSTNSMVHATIKGAKETAVSTNANSYLAFGVSNHNVGGLVERLRITGDGEVRVNNAAGASVGLNLYQISGAAAQVRFQGSATGTGEGDGFGLGNSGAVDAYVWNYEAGHIQFATSNSPRLTITSAGKVGIGENAPETLLHLKAATAPILTIQNTTNTSYTGIQFDRAADDTQFAIYSYDSSHSSQANNVQLYNYQSGAITLHTSGTERLRITSGGLVGIGTNVLTASSKLTLFEESGNGQTLEIKAKNSGGVGSQPGIKFTANNGDNIGGVYGDVNSDTLKIQTGGTDRVVISAGGIVTKPNQPAFCVYRNQSNWVLSAGDTFVFNTAEFNVGSHYNTSNGRFTAPIFGTYIFHFYSIYLNSSSNDYIQMYKNNARIQVGDVHFTNSIGSYWDNITYSRVIQLNANDYVHMRAATGHTFHGNNWGGWSGYMLG